MHVRLDYGSDGLDVSLPDHRVTIVEPKFHVALDAPQAALEAALRTPIGRPPLRQLVRPTDRVAISVCDVTRAQPRVEMLRAIFAELPDIPDEQIAILIATGTHRANTPAELERMLGREILGRFRVVNHNSRDVASLESAGRTATGVPIWLNRDWLAADIRITTGFVEPHFFAGFSGGPKMVAPGLAGLDTVLVLHDAARIGHPRATFGIVEGNPVHDDVREIARMTGVHFAIDVTLNRDQKITAVFAGDLFIEHEQACAAAKRHAMQPVNAPFDVVLTTNSGYPLDQNLYQAVKGMSAAAQVVKPGGAIVCAAECRDGLPAHGSYGKLLTSRSTPSALLEMIQAPGFAVPDQWQVQIQAQVLGKARVLMKNSCLTADAVRAAHLEPIDDVSEAVAELLDAAGPSGRVCVLPQGPQTIPYLVHG